jgi:hypothetical protein
MFRAACLTGDTLGLSILTYADCGGMLGLTFRFPLDCSKVDTAKF